MLLPPLQLLWTIMLVVLLELQLSPTLLSGSYGSSKTQSTKASAEKQRNRPAKSNDCSAARGQQQSSNPSQSLQ
jgi:hypothetical protein